MFKAIFSVLPFTIALYWTIILAIEYKRNNGTKKFLTFFMAICTVLYFSHAAYFFRSLCLFSLLESFYAFCSIAVYPLYYVYICKLTDDKVFPRKTFFVLLPAILIFLMATIIYALMGDCKLDYVQNNLFADGSKVEAVSILYQLQNIRMLLMKYIFVLQLIPVCYFGFKKLSAFNQKVSNYYADTENKSVSHIGSLLFVFVIFSISSAIVNYLGRESFIQSNWLIVVPSLSFSCLLFAVGYLGNKQDFTATDFYNEVNREDELEKQRNLLKDEKITAQSLHCELVRLMECEELFRQKGLRISDLAREVGSNRTYISNHINQEFNQSFSDYVNSYRIKYAQKLLASAEHTLSMYEIAERSGFSNEVSFYRTFKKHTKMTPTQWRARTA